MPASRPWLEERLQVAQHLRIAVGRREDAVHKIRSGQVEPFLGHGFAFVLQQVFGGIRQQFFNFSIHNLST